MVTAQEVGKLIGEKLAQNTRKDTSVQKRGTITTYFLFPNYYFQIVSTELKIEIIDIADYIVVGHSVNSQAASGNFKVGAPAGFSTIQTITSSFPVTLAFRKEVAKWLNAESFTEPSYGNIGTGTTAYDFSQTALVSESGTRNTIETKDNGTSKQVQYIFSSTDRNTQDVREVALFDALTSGNMAIRYVIDEIDMAVNDMYRFTFTLTLNDVTPGDAIITDYGLNEIRDAITGNTASVPSHMEWSDGTGAMAAGDTSLDGGNKQRNAVSTLTDSRPPGPGYKVGWLGILTTGQLNTIEVTKSGLFTDSGGSTLFAQNQFGAISKTSLFKVQEQDSITVR